MPSQTHSPKAAQAKAIKAKAARRAAPRAAQKAPVPAAPAAGTAAQVKHHRLAEMLRDIRTNAEAGLASANRLLDRLA